MSKFGWEIDKTELRLFAKIMGGLFICNSRLDVADHELKKIREVRG